MYNQSLLPHQGELQMGEISIVDELSLQGFDFLNVGFASHMQIIGLFSIHLLYLLTSCSAFTDSRWSISATVPLLGAD